MSHKEFNGRYDGSIGSNYQRSHSSNSNFSTKLANIYSQAKGSGWLDCQCDG
ncbi:hypothetical protein D8674_036828 [Pyrus ussuriensis x Pyrus communis]|uniref:Uncharacterized protein n=1 Tax=Pyrus ussuriensis x Pyrus communis TaxID=2448454 RepID=A0A5N5GA02_9ROSA|nr:hypothetical protein D8674_036828 [Pyrus ussuriensis x Pyrus communis]